MFAKNENLGLIINLLDACLYEYECLDDDKVENETIFVVLLLLFFYVKRQLKIFLNIKCKYFNLLDKYNLVLFCCQLVLPFCVSYDEKNYVN